MVNPEVLRAQMPPGFYPFWFWNDRLEAAEIRRQVREMAAKGIKGFYIHSRQGLGQPYLSDAFFEMVATAVDEARAQGLTVHLYDEYPYPTGAAGGEAILGSPHYRATELVQREYTVAGGPLRLELPYGMVLAARAYPLRDGRVDWSTRLDLRSAVGSWLSVDSYLETGLTTYNQKRYFASRPVPLLEGTLPPGEWRIFAAVQAEVTAHKYWGCFLDVLNPAAVREFLRLTDERYAQRLGAAFGEDILSIFTDETFPGWSALLPDQFRARYGYDLCDHLEALRDASYPQALQVRRHLRDLVYDLFTTAFERPLAEKRRALGLAYGGEKPVMRLAQLNFMDLPGCEPGHTKAGAPLDLLQPTVRGNARAVASAAYFYGKAGALDECYHSLGWSGTLQDARLMADGQLLLGIRYLVPHGFFYSTHALRKHDAPPTFFFQMPYWPFFGRLSAHIERVARYFEGTYIDAHILIVEPTWGLPTRADLQAYERLQNWLMAHHYDFLHVDTDILQGGHIQGGAVHIRDVTAPVVIVPPMQYIEEDLRRWLEDFEAQSGRVIYFGAADDPASLAGVLAERVEPSIQLRAEQGTSEGVWAVRRVSAEKTLWFLLNTTARPVDLHIQAERPLREIPLEDGRSPTLAPAGADYRRALAPFESCLLEAGETAPAPPLPHVTVRLDEPVEIELLTPNLLRMAHWQFALLDEAGNAGPSAWVQAAPIANQLAAAGLPFAPRFVQRFGLEPRLELPPLRARYEYTFHNEYHRRVELVMEPGSLAGDWQLWVNRRGPFGLADFSPSQAHVRGSLGMDISAFLEPGINRLRVEVRTERPDGGLLNPLYLAGDFGVDPNPPRLIERPLRGAFEDYRANRLPFFSGALAYRLEFNLPALPSGERAALELQTPTPCSEAMEVSINGGDFAPLLWQPHRVEVSTALLRPGRNQMEVRVHTSLIRAFEGQWFDETQHRYQTIE
mgnify:CR=1 FL=1